MNVQWLNYKDSVIAWYQFGNGLKPVFCFHGYGEDGNSFAFLEKTAGLQFSFYAIDLPFHGNTNWNEEQPFTSIDLLQIIQEICDMDNQKPKTINNKLILFGFSLGARVALSISQNNPAAIEKIILLAPDGIKVNRWYWFATQTWIGNRLFSFTMNHPSWFAGFLRLMGNLKLVKPSVLRFVKHYISNESARALLYRRWMVMRKLRPDTDHIKTIIRKNKIAVRLVYGKYDRIILSSTGNKFRSGIEEHCTVTVISSGHQVLDEDHAAELLTALLH